MIPIFSVPRIYEGETAVCIASGPSLSDADVAYARSMKAEGKCRIFVCNNNYLKVPEADVLFFCDKTFWVWHCTNPAFQDFKGTKITLSTEIGEPDINVMQAGLPDGLSTSASMLSTGGNSGYMTINLAFLYGIKRVILLGYEMQPKEFEEGDPEVEAMIAAGARLEKNAAGRYIVTHWFGNHKQATKPEWFSQVVGNFATMIPALERDGLEVINCSHPTAIQCFPKGNIQEVLK